MPNLDIIDLHSHYPMRFAPERQKRPHDSLLEVVTDNASDAVNAAVLRIARQLFSDPTPKSGVAISFNRYMAGGVKAAFSVLYSPFDELNVAGLLQKPPGPDAMAAIVHQLAEVEMAAAREPHKARVVRNAGELAQAEADGVVALIHCVEGGFHLGASATEVRRNAAFLKRLGVAYVTVAHLLNRQIATNVAAIPALPDSVYHSLHPQPATGLTPVGRAIIEALVENKILIDVTHMSEHSLHDTFDMLQDLDPAGSTPVIASHMACRLGQLEYNLPNYWIEEIHRRRGVMGVILCDHYMSEQEPRSPRTTDESFAVIRKHIDHIHSRTGSYEAVAIGSDHDGFIKPALAGYGNPATFRDLGNRLETHYGATVAKQICSQNTLRVLGSIWSAP